jgi:hypothetical protein
MTTNESLGERGFALRLNECIVCNAGTVSSSKMVADTIEAILAAVYMDAGVNGIASARAVVEHLGLNDHILLMVTFRAIPPPAFKNNQMITNMPFYSSPTSGPPQTSMLLTLVQLIKRGPGTLPTWSVHTPTSTRHLGVQS